jgi:hypothetical protein
MALYTPPFTRYMVHHAPRTWHTQYMGMGQCIEGGGYTRGDGWVCEVMYACRRKILHI